MKNKAISPVRRSLLAATALTGFAAISAPAFAQDGDQDDTIIVTGSRLNQANINSASPVTQIGAGEVDARGVTRIEELLNILPQAFSGQTSQTANGATGTSNLNLRGLGALRTLVLVDGKRLPYGTPSSSPANLDLIPAQLIERVDIVTGGASAVYGSDAIGGVANFILQRDFEGIMFDGQVGAYQDGNGNEFAAAVLGAGGIPVPGAELDGRNVSTSITFGANTADGRGNVTAFLSYQDQNEIRQDARDYSACAYGGSGPGPTSIGGIGCVGSTTFRRFFTPGGDLFLQEDGTFVPFVGGTAQTFNFAPDNFIQRNNERFSFSTMARYELTDSMEAYLDLGFSNNTTDAQIAFTGSFFRPFSVNCDNPQLGGAVSTGGTLADSLGCDAAAITAGTDVPLTFGYRNVTGDPRNSFIDLTTYRMVGGLRGQIGDNWNYDVFGQYAKTTQTRISQGDLNFNSLQDALFVVDDGSGGLACRSGNSNCIPFTVFDNSVTQEAARSAQGNGFRNGNTKQLVLGGTLNGDLGEYGFQFPWAENGVQLLGGVEWRRDELDSQPDDVSQIPGGMGFTGVGGGTLPVKGEVAVWELFMETQIPLIQGRPFFEELGINGAYRYSNYSTDGNGIQNSFSTNTFSAGVTWAPTNDVRFRGQFQRAVRAPNVIELFTGQNTGLFGLAQGANTLRDPCASTPTIAATATAAQCAFTGLSAAQYAGNVSDNSAGQYNSVSGGNPLLTPESSDTYTFGVVLTPEFVPGLSLSVDYFDITINDAISTVPATTTLDQCITTGNPTFCDNIVRDSFGSLYLSNVAPAGTPAALPFAGVYATNANISSLSTRGIDVAASYSVDVGSLGSVNLNYAATFLMELASIPVPGVTVTVECKGLYDGQCGNPNPEYRHRLLTTWQTPWSIDMTATWRYSSGVTQDTGQSAGGTFTAAANVLDATLDSAGYLDIAAQWYVRENVTLRAGINNVMGRDPELTTSSAGFSNGNTFAGVYDTGGRFLFFGVNLSL